MFFPMSDILRNAMNSAWVRNRDYAMRMVADITPEQFLAQPAPGRIINHPAWILCHLNVYAHVIACLLRAEPFEDPLGKPYSRGSTVTLNPADYPPPPAIIAEFTRLHDHAAAALDAAPDDLFTSPTPVERLRRMCPTVGELLITLMIKHESFHLGQLSAWRRAMGLAPVEM